MLGNLKERGLKLWEDHEFPKMGTDYSPPRAIRQIKRIKAQHFELLTEEEIKLLKLSESMYYIGGIYLLCVMFGFMFIIFI